MSAPADTSNVDKNSWITDEFLTDILKNKHSNKEDIRIVSKDITQAVGNAENYFSVLYRIKVQYKRGKEYETETSQLIVKDLPAAEYLQRIVQQMGAFDRELAMYHIVLPKIYKFAEERMRTAMIPPLFGRCYETLRCNTLVLDDLTLQGFRMTDRKKRLDLKHCQLVFRSLAKLHGVSAVLHQNNPNIIGKYQEIMWCEENIDFVGNYIPSLLKSIAEVSKNWEGFEHISAKITRILHDALNKLFNVVKLQEGGFHVMTHGDCWINNMMFKYSANGDPIDMRFVDLQLSRLASPALDLSYFMYSSPQTEVRIDHMDELLQEYHTHLCDTMGDLGGNCEMFTFNDLKDELKRTLFFGFVTSVEILGATVAQADDIPDIGAMKEEDVAEEEWNIFAKTHKSPLFREGFEPILSYCDELGVFD